MIYSWKSDDVLRGFVSTSDADWQEDMYFLIYWLFMLKVVFSAIFLKRWRHEKKVWFKEE